ncbi:MAG: hypothetical protein ACE5DL_03120 [Nitrosopumilaceae archaeon]
MKILQAIASAIANTVYKKDLSENNILPVLGNRKILKNIIKNPDKSIYTLKITILNLNMLEIKSKKDFTQVFL